MKTEAILCDIDGTIANHEGVRGHHHYHKVLEDKPIPQVIDLLSDLMQGDSEFGTPRPVIFLTGRPSIDAVRQDTLDWIKKNCNSIWYWMDRHYDGVQLFMRPAYLVDDYKETKAGHRDFRPDYVVKKELYHRHVEPFYNVQFAIDDRPQVLRLWHELGIFTFAVGTPWIDF